MLPALLESSQADKITATRALHMRTAYVGLLNAHNWRQVKGFKRKRVSVSTGYEWEPHRFEKFERGETSGRMGRSDFSSEAVQSCHKHSQRNAGMSFTDLSLLVTTACDRLPVSMCHVHAKIISHDCGSCNAHRQLAVIFERHVEANTGDLVQAASRQVGM